MESTNTFAAIEIKNTSFKFLLGYFYNNNVNVLYKKTYPLKVSNKDGDIFDIASLSDDLSQIKVITDPEKRLKVTINEVILLIHPFGLNVYEAEKTTNTISRDAKVSKTDIKNVLSMVEKSKLNEPNTEIVDIIPSAFILDENKTFKEPPLDHISDFITVRAHAFTLPIKTVENLKKAVTNAGLSVKRVVISPLGVNALLNYKKVVPDRYVLVDYNKDNTIVSFFGNNKLYDSKSFSYGGQNITVDIANSFEISIDKAEEIKCLYGLDSRNTSFKSPILSVVGDDEIPRKHNIEALNHVISDSLETWNTYFSNSLSTLLSDYGDMVNDIPLVFIGNGTLLNGFKDFICKNYPNNKVIFYSNDSVGALEPGDVNLLGAIYFVSKYRGSLEDETRTDVSSVVRKKEEYREDIDEL